MGLGRHGTQCKSRGLQAEEGGQKNIAGFCRPLIWHVTRMMELYKY